MRAGREKSGLPSGILSHWHSSTAKYYNARPYKTFSMPAYYVSKYLLKYAPAERVVIFCKCEADFAK